MKKYILLIGLLLCMKATATEYTGTMRMAGGYTMEQVRVSLDERGNLTLYQVKFARLMPVRLDIVFPGVECNQESNLMIIKGDSIIPTIHNEPRPDRIVKKLQGNAGGQTLFFRCLIGGKEMTYEGRTNGTKR